jgi:hypothetical protein
MAKDFFFRADDALAAALRARARVERRTVSNLIRLAVAKYLQDVGVLQDESAGSAVGVVPAASVPSPSPRRRQSKD